MPKRFSPFFYAFLSCMLLLPQISCRGQKPIPATSQPADSNLTPSVQSSQTPGGSSIKTSEAPDLAISVPYDANGIHFMLPAGVASGASSLLAPEKNPDANSPTRQPPHIVISLTNYTTASSLIAPEIMIYPLLEYANSDPANGQSISDLRKLLAEGTLSPEKIPLLPQIKGEQSFLSQIHYMDFQNGSGIRFITQYDSQKLPVNNQSILAIFQGVTTDGAYLVSARLPLSAPFLPDNASPETPLPENGIAFPFQPSAEPAPDQYASYIKAIAQKINRTPLDQFHPDLSMVDALITSLKVEPTTVLPASPAPISTTTSSAPAAGITATPLALCTDQAELEGENIADDSAFAPGQPFSKTWKLHNTGSCTWTTGYSLVFEEGEAMGNTNPQPFPKEVPPDSTVEISLPLTSPQTGGSYQGNWMLQNKEGKKFGVGPQGETPVWVKIIVTDAATGLNLGNPAWIDTFDKKSDPYWFLSRGDTNEFKIITGTLQMTAFQSIGDQWRIALYPPLGTYYMEARFITGEGCSGKDSYGLVTRASANSAGLYNSGYIIGISCSGEFRVYALSEGDFHGIQPWTPSPAIKAGPNQINTLGVILSGNVIKVYINNQQVSENIDNTFSYGEFGLFINSTDTPNFSVSVDQIGYWNIGQ